MEHQTSLICSIFLRSKMCTYADTLEGIPGIGPKGIEKFNSQKITNGAQILGMFLLEDRNKERFREWLIDVVGIRPQEVDGIKGKMGLIEAICIKSDQILGL